MPYRLRIWNWAGKLKTEVEVLGAEVKEDSIWFWFEESRICTRLPLERFDKVELMRL